MRNFTFVPTESDHVVYWYMCIILAQVSAEIAARVHEFAFTAISRWQHYRANVHLLQVQSTFH